MPESQGALFPKIWVYFDECKFYSRQCSNRAVSVVLISISLYENDALDDNRHDLPRLFTSISMHAFTSDHVHVVVS